MKSKNSVIKEIFEYEGDMEMSSRMSMICYFMEMCGIEPNEDMILDVENDEVHFEKYVFLLDDCEFNFQIDYISIVDSDGYDLTITKNGEMVVFNPNECYCVELQECLNQAEEEILYYKAKIAKQDKLLIEQSKFIEMLQSNFKKDIIPKEIKKIDNSKVEALMEKLKDFNYEEFKTKFENTPLPHFSTIGMHDNILKL